VQLVQYEKPQALSGGDEAIPLVESGQDEFQHHVVGEQDVWRVVEDVGAIGCPV
jgi:hypothetical protein